MDRIARTEQISSDKGKRLFNRLRRTYSEDNIKMGLSQEGSLSDLLSKSIEQRKLKEDWCAFLKIKKYELESEEKNIKNQINIYEDKYSKQEVFKLFQQNLKNLMDKSQKQFNQPPQRQFERNGPDQLAKQAVTNLLMRAKEDLKIEQQKHFYEDLLISAAIRQIVNEVEKLLDQKVVDQLVQEPLSQPKKQDLKQIVEGKLQQILEKLQQSLEIAPPLLDYNRLKNNLAKYSKEIYEKSNSIVKQMKTIKEKITKSKKEFESLREEEDKIYSSPLSDKLLDKIKANKFSNRMRDDELLNKMRDDELLNKMRADEFLNKMKAQKLGEYPFYDHTSVLRYAKEKEQDRRADLIQKIYSKYSIEEEKGDVNEIINESMIHLTANIAQEHIQEFKREAYKSYKHYHKMKSEEYNSCKIYEKTKKKLYNDNLAETYNEVAETYKTWNSAINNTDLAAEKLLNAEKNLKNLHLAINKELDARRSQYPLIVADAKQKLNDAAEQQCVTMSEESRRVYKDAGENCQNVQWREAYKETIIDLQEAYRLHDESLEKVKEAEILSNRIKDVFNDIKELYTNEKAAKEQHLLAKESLDEIDKYRNSKKDLTKVKKYKKAITGAILQASRELEKANLQEGDVIKLNNALKNKIMGNKVLKSYQEFGRVEKQILELKSDMENIQLIMSHSQKILENDNQEVIDMEKSLKIKQKRHKDYFRNIRNIERDCKLFKQILAEVQSDNLVRVEDNSEQNNELLPLQKSIRQIECDQKDISIEHLIEQRNKLALLLEQPSKSIADYQSERQELIENSSITYAEAKRKAQGLSTKISDKEKEEQILVSRWAVQSFRNTRDKYKKTCKSLSNESDSLNSQLEEREKAIGDLNNQLIEFQGDSSLFSQIILSKRDQEEQRDRIQDRIVHINRLMFRTGIGLEITNYQYKGNDDVKCLENLKVQYDQAIIAGLSFKKVAESKYESDKKAYDDEKSKFIKDITNKLNNRVTNADNLQTLLNKLRNEINEENTKLLSKKQELGCIKKELDSILLKNKQLDEKINLRKEEREKLVNLIKDINILELDENNLKKNIVDLPIERITQIYGLIPGDTKVPRVPPTTAKTRVQETTIHAAPIEIKAALSFLERDTASFATEERSAGGLFDNDSDDEFSVRL